MTTIERRTRQQRRNKKASKSKRQYKKVGKGIVNSLINKLPFEFHLPGYQYCGPGTKLHQRLARGDPGVNELDKACKKHDIAYLENDLSARHKADYGLEQAAWKRVKAKDVGFKEKAAAWLVTNIMKGKRRLGLGCKSQTRPRNRKRKNNARSKSVRKIAFGAGLVGKVRNALRKVVGSKKVIAGNVNKTTSLALHIARRYLKEAGGKRNIRVPRIIPVPKVGGILPLIPIFAGLSALGGLAGTAAGIAKAVNDVKAAREQLANTKKHYSKMEEIAMGKHGSGLYLKPYRKGLGLYLKRDAKN